MENLTSYVPVGASLVRKELTSEERTTCAFTFEISVGPSLVSIKTSRHRALFRGDDVWMNFACMSPATNQIYRCIRTVDLLGLIGAGLYCIRADLQPRNDEEGLSKYIRWISFDV